MSGSSKPVWIWLPGDPEPTECGLFSLTGTIGTGAGAGQAVAGQS